MHRPENNHELSKMAIEVQQLAAALDVITRDRGIHGLATQMAKIQEKAREAEWKCNDVLYKEKENGQRDGVVR